MKHGLIKSINNEISTEELSTENKILSILHSLDIIRQHLMLNFSKVRGFACF